ncbi:MAG TPA: PIG-L family deacetylase [Roseiflexaceae bacterium]|nr:PIG-L family deacetylase [Roseiflexaceae bacterium]
MSATTATDHPLRILGVFAHPDDESFCAGGTLARYAAAGAETMVVSATRGDAGQIRDARAATRRTLGEVRERELHAACARLGVRHALCLDYGDGTLKDIDQEALTGHVARIIRGFRPDVVITFGEDGAYGHPDHIAISTATTAACRRAGDAAAFPEQLAEGLMPHAPGKLYHSHFPRSRLLLLERLVQWLMGHEARFRGSYDFIRALLLLAEETNLLGYAADHVDVQWYPPGFYIIEQNEPASKLYLILSGQAEAIREDPDGALHPLERLQPGAFFGEQGLAHHKPRNAHVVAVDSVTCLVFAPSAPTAFAGRGATASADLETHISQSQEELCGGATTCIDVRDFVGQKMAAIAAHRTQYPLEPDMLPLSMLQEMMGREYFVRVLPPLTLECEL